ncbi:hypothetical protein EJB05_34794, partial [Eragrostis curvula]
MVDLLARAGHLEEAWDSHEKIPGREDTNVEVGEKVIHRIMKLEPSNSWNYVVSSKIYATTDRLDDSAMMIGLEEFYEPQHGAEDIYELMDILVDYMKLAGYIPNFDLV